MPHPPFPLEGGCGCRHVRYRMLAAPLIVHCCHCRWCQRETGSAFALNAMIESEWVIDLAAAPELIDTPSESGAGQQIARCPHCKVALWSHYAGAGPLVKFVRVGTLDEPDHLPPDIHIFTASKQPWVVLPEGARAVPEYYEREAVWSPEALARREVLRPRIEAYHAQKQAQQQTQMQMQTQLQTPSAPETQTHAQRQPQQQAPAGPLVVPRLIAARRAAAPAVRSTKQR